MSKESTLRALNKYMEREAKKSAPKKTRRKYQKPEAEFVKELKKLLETMGIEVATIESKAVYHAKAGRYLNSQTSESLPDLIGDDGNGNILYIEAKAPGKRHTLKPHQFDFLERKIKRNCFAICTDNLDHFVDRYRNWQNMARLERARYLLSDLPRSRQLKESQGTVIF